MKVSTRACIYHVADIYVETCGVAPVPRCNCPRNGPILEKGLVYKGSSDGQNLKKKVTPSRTSEKRSLRRNWTKKSERRTDGSPWNPCKGIDNSRTLAFIHLADAFTRTTGEMSQTGHGARIKRDNTVASFCQLIRKKRDGPMLVSFLSSFIYSFIFFKKQRFCKPE